MHKKMDCRGKSRLNRNIYESNQGVMMEKSPENRFGCYTKKHHQGNARHVEPCRRPDKNSRAGDYI
jgi:hypothetical protein